MGKHNSQPDPSNPVPGTVSEETWAQILLAGVTQPGGEQWFDTMRTVEDNAKNN
jgi:hypothetical protein